MTATLHAITARSKDHPARRAQTIDFVLDAGVPASPERVLTQTGWSLFCLDQPTHRAVFVRTPDGCDLSSAPFLRMAQFEHASHVLFIAWDQLEALAEQIPVPSNVIFVFGIGRSGTTLVSRMLGQVQGVHSLSEPNAQFDATMHRASNGPELTKKLIGVCTRLLCRQPDGTVPKTLAFKLYSQSLFNCADYHAAFPDARYVFLYRDGLGWANSVFKMARGYGMAESLNTTGRDDAWRIISSGHDIGYLEKFVPTVADTCFPSVIYAAAWALHMETYLDLLTTGVPFLALRYNEMNKDREAATKLLLTHCNLPEIYVSSAMKSFDYDAQEGSGIGLDNRTAGFSSESIERFHAAMARRKAFKDPDVRLPDMYDRGT